MKRLLILLLALILSHTAFAQSDLQSVQKRGTLRMGSEIGYSPFEMTDKAGKFIGFDVSLMEETAKRMGVKLEIIDTPWDDLIPGLVSGKYDIVTSGMTITTDRKVLVDFTSPYFASGQTLLVNKRKSGQIRSFRDINTPGIKIVTKQGTTAEDIVSNFFSKARVTLMNNPEDDIVAALIRDEADVFVYDYPYLAVAAADHKDSTVFLPDPFTYEPFGMAVKKGNITLVERINAIIEAMKADGTYKKLHDYWFNGTEWRKNM